VTANRPGTCESNFQTPSMTTAFYNAIIANLDEITSQEPTMPKEAMKKEALEYHRSPTPGKISVHPTKPCLTQQIGRAHV